MQIIWHLLSALAGLASLVCWVIVLIEMFRDELWKGLVGLLCGFYMLYYCLFELEHEYKWPLVLGVFGGGAISAGLAAMAR
ncbi:MAG TPA: hypothetical protein VKT78_14305 [Fimbriimonadaceae bacterium]|nr:hypothetical protein [Fimbriimonadaceae bacterium]